MNIPNEGGIWTMTDAEFKKELAKAWDEGHEADDFEVSIGLDRNPYRTQDKK